jgi:hypothetical protein
MRLAKLTNLSDLHATLVGIKQHIEKGRRLEVMPEAVLYPTHRTADEKAERTKKRRAVARKAKKESA